MVDKKRVYVEWRDASSFSDGSWVSRDNLDSHGLMEVRTCGFLWEETKELVTVVMQYDDGDQFMGGIAIPKVCITKIERF